MSSVTVNGLSLHYELAGSGPPVLFIHGLGSSTRDWEKQVDSFSATNRLIMVDLRGHGRSDKPPGPYSVKGFADDVASLVDALKIDSVTVVGISLGGMVGFQLAADHPDLVEALVVVNAVQAFELASLGQKVQIAVRKLIVSLMGMEKMGQVLGDRLFPDEDKVEERALMAERWAENDKRAYQTSFQAILDWPGVVEEMKRFTKPVLVVASDQDYTTVESKVAYIDKIPTAELVVVRNAHHAVPVERPEEFNTVLKGFLTGL